MLFGESLAADHEIRFGFGQQAPGGYAGAEQDSSGNGGEHPAIAAGDLLVIAIFHKPLDAADHGVENHRHDRCGDAAHRDRGQVARLQAGEDVVA